MADNKDLTLAETYIAGTTHIPDFAAIKQQLTPGTRLDLVREMNNDFDGWAIRVETVDGKKTGFVPRAVNEVPAHLMDAGYELYGEVSGFFYENGWEMVMFFIRMKREGACAAGKNNG
ncbi:MAG TPA: HIRAN domain-containing protein [Methanocorpusculum sp.]|nr:HIRAN domain-containing protein [Methanocorpusculum sp.]